MISTKGRDVEIQLTQPDDAQLKHFILSKPATALVEYKFKLLTWLFVALIFRLTSKTAFGPGLFVSARQLV